METVKKGTFYAVGVGPGDPELITQKAVRILTHCGVIAAPVTAGGQMLAWDIAAQAVDLSGKQRLALRFSMSREESVRRRAHLAAADAGEEYLARGADVAMLNLGDVSLYATASYLAELLRERGYETVMIPGVPSFCAVAARLGVSLTQGDGAVHILPGGSAEEALSWPGTKILMKSGRELPEVLALLRERSLLDRSRLVKNCGLPGEEVWDDLSRTAPESDAGYFATLIVKE